MMFYRPGCLLVIALSLAVSAAYGQQQPQPQQQPQQQPRKPDPFENVPVGPAQPAPPQKAPPATVRQARPGQPPEDVIESIVIRGSRRVPQDTLKALMYAKPSDKYSEDSLHRDFMALWNTGRFDDLRLERERGPGGGVVIRFVVTERRVVRSVDYEGNKSISKSEILDRFKERKVSLTPESQFDMGKVQRAKNVLQEY